MRSEKKYRYRICQAVLALAVMFFCVFTGELARANTVTTDRTEVTLTSNVSAIYPQQKFWLALHIKMQPGWHTYWINPGDSGMVPNLAWTLPNGFVTGTLQFPPPDSLQVGDLVDYGYSDNAWLLVPVTAPSVLRANAVSILALKARWLVCKDICIPEAGDFSIALPTSAKTVDLPGPDNQVITNLVNRLPVTVPLPLGFYIEEGKIHFDFPLGSIAPGSVKSTEFFPAQEGFTINNAPQGYDMDGGNVSFELAAEKGKLPGMTSGLVSLYLKDGSRKDFAVSLQLAGKKSGTGFSIIRALLSALVGGLILNLMPCVFPILSLKALVVAKKAEKRPHEVRTHGIVYTLGVVASFLALAAILIFIQMSGRTIGWGYQMQSPEFVAAMLAVFFVVGLNLSGVFEMPGLFGNLGGDVATRDNLMGSFCTGALAVLVATPCTAPFMAPAIGFALTQTAPVIIAIFGCLGLGLAAPFLLISWFPAFIGWLPKPGAWMLTFRQALAFPMYLCALWLLWVLIREVGQDAVFIALAGLVFLAFAIWLNTRDSAAAGISGLIIGALALVAVIGCGDFAPGSSTETNAEKFSGIKLEELRGEGQAVFVDATADWCITCKVNESVALSSHAVRAKFAEKNITYMVADWTHGDPEITAYLKSFGRAGVPIYVYYQPHGDPVVLPQILTKSIVLKAIK